MSGDSETYTLLARHSEVPEVLDALAKGDYSILNRYEERLVSTTTSPNNWLEFELRALIRGFGIGGLSYMGSWEELRERGGWTVSLRDTELNAAAAALRQFLAKLRQHPDQCTAILNAKWECYTQDEVAQMLAEPPPGSMAEASARFERAHHGERSDFGFLLAFLDMHLAALDRAVAEDCSVVYAVCLY
jgi:hypothetical protein